MPSKKKKYSARFPPARIKKIMQTDEEVGKVNAAVPVIISRALELFIEGLIVKTGQTTQMRNAKTLSTAHIKHTILSEKKFDFLKDLVANIPDVQGEEECDANIAARPRIPRDPNQPRKPGRPRKQVDPNENTVRRGRPRKERNTSSTSSDSLAGDNSEFDDEDTETDEEERPSYENTNGPVSFHQNSAHVVSPSFTSGGQPSTSTAVPYQYQHPPAMMAHLPANMMSSLQTMIPPAPPGDDDDYDT